MVGKSKNPRAWKKKWNTFFLLSYLINWNCSLFPFPVLCYCLLLVFFIDQWGSVVKSRANFVKVNFQKFAKYEPNTFRLVSKSVASFDLKFTELISEVMILAIKCYPSNEIKTYHDQHKLDVISTRVYVDSCHLISHCLFEKTIEKSSWKCHHSMKIS